MEIDRKELKRQAKLAMHRAKPPFWVVSLVFILMTTGVSLVLNTITFPVDQGGFNFFGLFVSILFALYSAVVTFGHTLWSLWTHRSLDPDLSALTQGFTVTGKVLLLEINIQLRLLLWTMVAIPLLGFVVFPLMGPLSIIFGSVLIAGVMMAIYYRYALAPFLLADNPDAGPLTAIRRSVELMRGWRWELFKLDFSFMGWELLNGLFVSIVVTLFASQTGLLSMSVSGLTPYDAMSAYSTLASNGLVMLCSTLVSLPIGMWLLPYRRIAKAGFYDARLRYQQESAPKL